METFFRPFVAEIIASVQDQMAGLRIDVCTACRFIWKFDNFGSV